MTDFKYFTRDEFVCTQTGENEIKDSFIDTLDILRERCGFPFKITSGYRSPRHSIEAAKDKPGQHTKGHAADIRIAGGVQRRLLVANAIELGLNGIGVAKTYVHVDKRLTTPVMWVY